MTLRLVNRQSSVSIVNSTEHSVGGVLPKMNNDWEERKFLNEPIILKRQKLQTYVSGENHLL